MYFIFISAYKSLVTSYVFVSGAGVAKNANECHASSGMSISELDRLTKIEVPQLFLIATHFSKHKFSRPT